MNEQAPAPSQPAEPAPAAVLSVERCPTCNGRGHTGPLGACTRCKGWGSVYNTAAQADEARAEPAPAQPEPVTPCASCPNPGYCSTRAKGCYLGEPPAAASEAVRDAAQKLLDARDAGSTMDEVAAFRDLRAALQGGSHE